MGISVQEAIDLLDGIDSKEELTALIEQLDTMGNGKSTTVFWNDDYKDTAKALQNDYRTIHKTEAYKFLQSDEFIDRVVDIIQDSTERNNFINVDIGKGGAWDTVSKNFAKNTSGDIVALIGESATKDRIWFQTEYPELLRNGSITTINGINSNQYFFSADIKEQYVLDRMKIETIARADAAVNTGKNIMDVTKTDMEAVYKNTDFVDKINKMTYNYNVGDLSKLHSYMGKLGIFGSALGFTIATVQAQKAYAEGNEKLAEEIMLEFGVTSAGGAAGGAGGSVITAAGLTLLVGIGLTVSAPVAAVIIVAGGFAGGFFGDKFAKDFYDNYLKDLDGNGKREIFDKLGDLLYGSESIQTKTKELALLGNNVTLYNPTTTQFISNARTSQAWAYALERLNPFVIEGIDYSNHAVRDFSEYSDTYIIKRTEMLQLWHEQIKNGQSGDTLIAENTQGTWQYVDHFKSHNPFGNNPGGTGVQTHIVKFGDDYLEGGDKGDYLFGHQYGDTLVGNDGEDHLEGASGNDYLYGGSMNGADDVGDYLSGGSGYDRYYAGTKDTIKDNKDGEGEIYFDRNPLSGKKTEVKDSNGYMYEDDKYRYILENPNGIGLLTIVERGKENTFTDKYILVENFDSSKNDGYLGIILSDSSDDDNGDNTKKDVEIYVGDATVKEGGVLEFTVGIDNILDKDLILNVESYFNGSADASDIVMPTDKTITILAGEPSGTFTIDTVNDSDTATENFIFAVTGYEYSGDDTNSILIKNAGEGTITDDDSDEDDNDEDDDNNDDNSSTLKVEVSDGSRIEINGEITFDITLIGTLEAGETLTVNLETFDGSATSSYDYASTSGTVTFDGSSSTQTFNVSIYDDPYKEGHENFYVDTVGYSGYTGDKEVLLPNIGTGTILDDDAQDGQVAIEVSSTSADEGDSGTQSAEVCVSISSALSDDLFVNMSDGNSYTIKAGTTSTTARVFWEEGVVDIRVDSDDPVALSIVDFDYFGDEENIFIGHSGQVEIIDDDNGTGHSMNDSDMSEPPRLDPLVLDVDKDGFISTTSLNDSSAYFDLTGDGIKERVGWIQANDGLVAYDKNDNGKIDGINEVFGNATTSGFDELREIADSNSDGIIDRRDELYNRLKVWQDTNEDGISQEDELISLSEAGVKSIDLDAISTNIEVNGNVITEASKYTDSQGNLELIADLELEFDSRITNIDTTTIEDYTEHLDSDTLPFLRGYGVVHDSNVAYNVNDDFRELAVEFASDVTKVANNFESYMDSWSGYNQMLLDLQEKYQLSDLIHSNKVA